ncbi:MAG: 3,4-dihydroxy-2-butanone-4-phosphate synthase [Verrucomicrobia bacterium]|nr:3,4-dihydroxy-2-butanone-4-phosphate synthase [Verrucomicrobiota bacterium]
MSFDRIEDVLTDLRGGRPVIVTDDADRENEGDLIFGAEHATPELVAFMVRYTSGVICVPMQGGDLDRLDLPLMTRANRESMRTAFTISVDAREGIGTGISAADRARTIRLLADPNTTAKDFVRPGHIFPLRYRDGGVLSRAGHTEAAIDLVRLAGLRPVGVLAEVTNDDGSMARLPELIRFKQEHGLKLYSIEDLIAYRSSREKLIRREQVIHLPTDYGPFELYLYRSLIDEGTHIALVHGDLQRKDPALVRVHRENSVQDLFGSRSDAVGNVLHRSLEQLAQANPGVLVYLRQESRGTLTSLPFTRLASFGEDEAGPPPPPPSSKGPLRENGLGAQILTDLGITRLRLLTDSPKKVVGLDGFGLEIVEHVPLHGPDK